MMKTDAQIRWYTDLSLADLADVGGKNASLGELAQQLAPHGIRLAPGFATTAQMFREFLEHNDLQPRIDAALSALSANSKPLTAVGSDIRSAIEQGECTDQQSEAIRSAYLELCGQCEAEDLPVAVRSSSI